VRNYVSSIFAKLNVTDRTQAVIIALRHGLIAE
jgi:DNA-binding NarL/FixJ family response regulator